LIRSKGVGVYFITQNPADVPEDILGQLGNRVQHALRAFTAKDQKDLRMAADNYRPNPRFDVAEAIRDVGTGEAVTSFLEAKGIPGMVERTLVRPPRSQIGPVDAGLRAQIIAASPLAGKYDRLVDRDSAYEVLKARAEQAATAAEQAPAAPADDGLHKARRYGGGGGAAAYGGTRAAPARRSDNVADAFAKSFARQIGSTAGRAIVRGVLGSLFKGR
ncbi:MAG: DUF853 family protein, partial [Rhodobacteraceae bacterium]|nr:DUF853 family protein [Paracoccaceae bacterium]